MTFRLLTVLLLLGSVASAQTRPMTALDLWTAKRLGTPTVSPAGDWCAIDVTTWDVEKEEATTQIWLLSTDGKTQRPLTAATGRSSGPKWSPDGKSIAFLSQRAGDEVAQVYVIAIDGGEARRVTRMPMAPSSLKWSNDSTTLYGIAWTWPGTADDATHTKLEKQQKETKSKAMVIDSAQFRYWDKWTTDGKRPTIYAIDLATGKHTNLLAKSGRFLPPTEPSAGDYDVSPDGKEVAFVSDSTSDYGLDFNSDIYALDIATGDVKNLTTDNTAADTSPAYSPDGKSLAFLRQRIKHFYADQQKLMVRDRSTGEVKSITEKLDRTCLSPKWLPDSKRIAFEAEDAGYVRIFFVDTTTHKIITDKSPVSERAIDFSRENRVGVYLQSTFNRPPTLFAHRAGAGAPIKIETFNDALVSQWNLGKVESRTFKGAGGAEVQHWVVYPPNFDPNKKWPLIQVVHGGPHNGIMSEFSFRWNLQLWAAQGYVVGCVNFHGSSGFGQSFTDSIAGAVGDKPMEDIMKSTDWFVEQPWIDRDRLATAGASYGGYMMAWLNGHTDRFKVMVCHAGVYDWHSMMASDFVKGRDRALGAFPWDDPTKVDKQSAQRFADKFKTPTLVLHGERDYRVPVAQGFAYYTTLRQKGVPTRLVYFPDENHWVLKPQNSLLWHREVFGWIAKYVPPGQK